MNTPPPHARVLSGRSEEWLPTFPDAHFDAIVTDPPYGMTNLPASKVVDALQHWLAGDTFHIPDGRGFMNRRWDKFVPPPGLWSEALRILKPGGHAAVFASSRTADLMGISLRLAGFEVRDTLVWHYGTGLPKAKGLLKPGFEPILLVRRPFKGSATANRAEWGVGSLFTDRCRLPFVSAADQAESEGKNQHTKYGTMPGGNHIYGDFSMVAGVRPDYDGSDGRWPANVLLSHHPDCVPAGETEVRSGSHFPARRGPGGISSSGHCGQDALPELTIRSEKVASWRCTPGCPVAEMDRQSAAGLGDGSVVGASRFFYTSKASSTERVSYRDADGNTVAHDTVKPLALMRWLVRLVTPPGGTLLDCFAGSGTTGEAAALEGFSSVLVEEDPKYLPLIAQRLGRVAPSKAA